MFDYSLSPCCNMRTLRFMASDPFPDKDTW